MRRGLGFLLATAAALLVLAGCGSSARGPAVIGGHAPPASYVIYRGPGFSLALPRGWRSSPYRTDAEEGGVSFVAPGQTPVIATYPRIDTEVSVAGSTLTPQQDFAEFIANLQGETTFTVGGGQPLAQHVEVAKVRVPHARAARLVTIQGSGGRQERHLVVLTRSGVIAVSVAWYRPGYSLSPTAVIDSFRLS